MSRRLYTLFLCLAMLFTNIAKAQDFNIFAKQRVVIADIRDMNDRPLSDAIKSVVRTNIIEECTNSDDFEVYEVNMDDIRQQIIADGQTPSFANICKAIGSSADYIIFTSIKASASTIGSRNVTIFITCSLYRIGTASEILVHSEEAAPNSEAISAATSNLMAKLLGIEQKSNTNSTHNINSQQQAKTYKVGDFYDENGKQGIVFMASNDGKHGKILSRGQTYTDWDTGKSWCEQMGDGWRLPTNEELLELRTLKDNEVFNDGMLSADEGISWSSYYWTNQASGNKAWIVNMYNGYTRDDVKDDSFYVRAVSAF